MTKKSRQGLFSVIDSFAIKRRNEFYLIGSLIEGEVCERWFVNIPFNKSLSLSLRIKQIEDLEMSSESGKYKLLIVNGNESGDDDLLNLLLGLKIGSELLDITITGED